METSDSPVTVKLVDGATQTAKDQDTTENTTEKDKEIIENNTEEEIIPPPPPPRFRFLRFGNKNN